jgi:DNA replication protein DnaC
LCEEELLERERRRLARHLTESHLPPTKTLHHLDFDANATLPRQQVVALAAEGGWVERAENLLLFGPSGVGKTHIAAAIGHGLVAQGIRVRFTSATALVQALQAAKQALQLADALAKLDKYRLLILDDLGYVQRTEMETAVLFELIAHRYESGSLLITSNHPFSDWDRIFPDTMMTVAAIDRLIHHAQILSIGGESYRKGQSLARRTTQESPARRAAKVVVADRTK